jgi:hypothetical protein
MFKQHTVTYGFAALCLAALPAQAAVYVTGKGADTNPCTIDLPCRQISHALTVAAAGGEIIVSGSGEFQSFTVNKSISILAAPGVHAGVASSTSTAIVVSTAATGDYVHLSGLDVTSNGTGNTGILIITGSTTIDNCTIHDSTYSGITLDPRFGGQVNVSNTTITATPTGYGVNVFGGMAVIEHCTLLLRPLAVSTTGGGVWVGPGTLVLRDSVLDGWSGGSSIGLEVTTLESQPTPTRVVVDHCLFTNWGNLALNSTGGITEVSNSTFAYNAVGVSAGGTVLSFGNNAFIGNTTDGAFTSTAAFK